MPLDLTAIRADMQDRIDRGVNGADLSARTVAEILDRAIAAEIVARAAREYAEADLARLSVGRDGDETAAEAAHRKRISLIHLTYLHTRKETK